MTVAAKRFSASAAGTNPFAGKRNFHHTSLGPLGPGRFDSRRTMRFPTQGFSMSAGDSLIRASAFIDASPPPHAVASVKVRLAAAGYTELREDDPWPRARGRYRHSQRARSSSLSVSWSLPRGPDPHRRPHGQPSAEA